MPYRKPPVTCPVCKEEAQFKFIQDYKNNQGNWSLYECSRCKVQFWEPFKSPGAEWYETLDGYVVRDITKPKIRRGYHKRFLQNCQNLPGKAKILDLGCGTGEFLAELQKKGYEVWGVDFDGAAIEIARSCFGIKNAYSMSFDDFFAVSDEQRFDIVTLFEVIEHIDDPFALIQKIAKVIKENGLIVLSTPSRERILANSIKADFPYHHLSRWNEEAISNLLSKIGFKIAKVDYVEQFQFILDALSERFRFGLVKKTLRQPKKGKEVFFPQTTVFTGIVHSAAKAKDYVLCGAPAVILFSMGLLKKQKNGDMLIWAKKN